MSMTCPNCGIIDDHTQACLDGELIWHNQCEFGDCYREAPLKTQKKIVNLLNRLATGEDVGSEYQHELLACWDAYKIAKRGDRNIQWTHEMDVALVKSFMGDMHNFFVFCRQYDIWTDEAFARDDHLKVTEEFEQLGEEARILFEGGAAQREANSEVLAEICDKGCPANAKDREWLAMNEW